MKAGIVYHSQTGTTRDFAEKVAAGMRARGHAVDVIVIEPEGEVRPHQSDVKLKRNPEYGGYDALLIGGPIWAFGMSPVAVAFADGLRDFPGKVILPFATMGAPVAIMGGIQGMAKMRRCLRKSGATVLKGVVGTGWARRTDAEKQAVVTRVLALLGIS